MTERTRNGTPGTPGGRVDKPQRGKGLEFLAQLTSEGSRDGVRDATAATSSTGPVMEVRGSAGRVVRMPDEPAPQAATTQPAVEPVVSASTPTPPTEDIGSAKTLAPGSLFATPPILAQPSPTQPVQPNTPSTGATSDVIPTVVSFGGQTSVVPARTDSPGATPRFSPPPLPKPTGDATPVTTESNAIAELPPYPTSADATPKPPSKPPITSEQGSATSGSIGSSAKPVSPKPSSFWAPPAAKPTNAAAASFWGSITPSTTPSTPTSGNGFNSPNKPGSGAIVSRSANAPTITTAGESVSEVELRTLKIDDEIEVTTESGSVYKVKVVRIDARSTEVKIISAPKEDIIGKLGLLPMEKLENGKKLKIIGTDWSGVLTSHMAAIVLTRVPVGIQTTLPTTATAVTPSFGASSSPTPSASQPSSFWSAPAAKPTATTSFWDTPAKPAPASGSAFGAPSQPVASTPWATSTPSVASTPATPATPPAPQPAATNSFWSSTTPSTPTSGNGFGSPKATATSSPWPASPPTTPSPAEVSEGDEQAEDGDSETADQSVAPRATLSLADRRLRRQRLAARQDAADTTAWTRTLVAATGFVSLVGIGLASSQLLDSPNQDPQYDVDRNPDLPSDPERAAQFMTDYEKIDVFSKTLLEKVNALEESTKGFSDRDPNDFLNALKDLDGWIKENDPCSGNASQCLPNFKLLGKMDFRTSQFAFEGLDEGHARLAALLSKSNLERLKKCKTETDSDVCDRLDSTYFTSVKILSDRIKANVGTLVGAVAPLVSPNVERYTTEQESDYQLALQRGDLEEICPFPLSEDGKPLVAEYTLRKLLDVETDARQFEPTQFDLQQYGVSMGALKFGQSDGLWGADMEKFMQAERASLGLDPAVDFTPEEQAKFGNACREKLAKTMSN